MAWHLCPSLCKLLDPPLDGTCVLELSIAICGDYTQGDKSGLVNKPVNFVIDTLTVNNLLQGL